MRFILLSILFCSVVPVFAQNFEQIDLHASKASKEDTKSIRKLSDYLTSPYQTDLEKVRSIYAYTANEIEYNQFFYLKSQNFKPELLPTEIATPKFKIQYKIWKFKKWLGRRDYGYYQDPEYVLKTGTGVCLGVAELFKALCDSAGIESYVIGGYAKGYLYQPGDPFFRGNHAWNTVKLDGNFKLLDPTWKEWISTPDSFLVNHLPMDPMWQLKEFPISIQQFEEDSVGYRRPWDKKGADTVLPIYNGKYPLAFNDSIQSWKELNEFDQELIGAFRANQFNPKNHSEIGYTYLRLSSIFSDEKLMRELEDSREFVQAAKNKALECANMAEFHFKECKKVEIPTMYNVQKNRYKEEYKAIKSAIKEYKSELKAEIKEYKAEYQEDKKQAKLDHKEMIAEDKAFYQEMIDELKAELEETKDKEERADIKMEIKIIKAEMKESQAMMKSDKRYETAVASARKDGFSESAKSFYKEEEERLEKILKEAEKRKDKLTENEQKRKEKETEENERYLKAIKQIKSKL